MPSGKTLYKMPADCLKNWKWTKHKKRIWILYFLIPTTIMFLCLMQTHIQVTNNLDNKCIKLKKRLIKKKPINKQILFQITKYISTNSILGFISFIYLISPKIYIHFALLWRNNEISRWSDIHILLYSFDVCCISSFSTIVLLLHYLYLRLHVLTDGTFSVDKSSSIHLIFKELWTVELWHN